MSKKMLPIRKFLRTVVKLLTQIIHRLQDISELLFKKPKLCGLQIIFTSATTSDTHTQVHGSGCSFVADSARDGVLLHVSASSERQEWGNETGLTKKRTNTNSGICEPTCGTFKQSYN